jgi:hypothetical protein
LPYTGIIHKRPFYEHLFYRKQGYYLKLAPKNRKNSIKMKESDLQKTIIDYLRLKKIFVFKLNNWGFRKPNGGFIPAQTKGLPDLICHIKGQVIYLEIKQEKGILSEHQKVFQKQCTDDMVNYFVIRNLDDIINLLTKYGYNL